MKPKRTWKQVDGVLLLDKPSDMTSNDALQKARRLFSAAKAGHTGTLDPLASGLLPLCFGDATKFAADLLDADKAYHAELQLGVTTTTGDAEGDVLETRPVPVLTPEQLENLLNRFRGPIRQVPPMYSALKRDGRPLYELARQGIEVEREARDITIHSLVVEYFSGAVLHLAVDCSKGTYIRSLAEDIGAALGCGAHLTGLRRTRVGDLGLAQAVTLEVLQGQEEEARGGYLRPLDSLLQSLPAVDLEPVLASRFCHGNPVQLPGSEGGKIRVYEAGRLLGVGEAVNGELRPKRLLRQEQ